MKILKHLPILFMFSLCSISCDDDENPIICPNPYEMGTFEMLESSKALFPYDDTQTIVIFSDSLGNEYSGTLAVNSGLGTLSGPDRTCLDNEDISIEVRARIENQTASIQIPEISMVLNINYRSNPDLTEYESNLVADVAIVSGPQLPGGPIPQMFIVLDERSQQGSFSNLIQPMPVLSIHGKTYELVYSNEHRPNDGYLLYYNFTQGVVGFTNKASGNSYKLERVE